MIIPIGCVKLLVLCVNSERSQILPLIESLNLASIDIKNRLSTRCDINEDRILVHEALFSFLIVTCHEQKVVAGS